MSDPVVRIPADKLRSVFELLMRHAAQGSGDELGTVNDYFWSVPSPAVYDVYNEPTELTIGQISASWSNLETMLEDESKVLGYGFVWLAEVLRALGDEAVG